MARGVGSEDHIKLESNTYKVVIDNSSKLNVSANEIVPTVPIHSATISTVVLSASVAQTTLEQSQHFVIADATSANFGVVLPDAATNVGCSYTVKKVDVSANSVVLSGSGTDEIEGAAILVLNSEGESATVMSDGVSWRIVGFYSASLGV
jgi:hypothetical protein